MRDCYTDPVDGDLGVKNDDGESNIHVRVTVEEKMTI